MERNIKLDLFKGVAISLVLIGHSIQGACTIENSDCFENIFFKNSPLHDGAMIISHGRIKAAGCILPISHDTDTPKSLGLRHRAALGISQKSDCIAVVVSEETGGISIAEKGNFRLRLSAEELESVLSKEWIKE